MAFIVNAKVEPHYPIKRSQINKAAKATLEAIDPKGDVRVDISIIGDRKMRTLNRDYRGIDKSTDVLSFSFGETKEGTVLSGFVNPPEEGVLNLGDVLISYPQLLERAARENMLVDEMLNLLIVHGILHLFGYDHEKPEEAFVMENLEDQILVLISPVKPE